jgi:hypothetical protein
MGKVTFALSVTAARRRSWQAFYSPHAGGPILTQVKKEGSATTVAGGPADTAIQGEVQRKLPLEENRAAASTRALVADQGRRSVGGGWRNILLTATRFRGSLERGCHIF